MGFLDNLSKTLSTGTDRVKFEAEKFQRTNKISGEVNNLKSQVDTNLRQLGERTLELYQQGSITAPDVASLAQIIAQLRDQLSVKEKEYEEAQSATFESTEHHTGTSATGMPAQQVPITSETTHSSAPAVGATPVEHLGTLPPASSVPVAGTTPYACPNCGYSLPQGAVFCPNCGAKQTGS
ncbi:MAG: zinc-ribbon domain-containing protein [Herpetosiphonaceae bacterium]|nr:zinc-ribbon domain-containing protein [Herpetosiphonaceae bacterium]